MGSGTSHCLSTSSVRSKILGQARYIATIYTNQFGAADALSTFEGASADDRDGQRKRKIHKKNPQQNGTCHFREEPCFPLGVALGASQRREKYARKAPAEASAGSRLRSASWQNREDRQGEAASMRQPGAGTAVLLKLAHAAWGCSAAEGTDANDEHMALNEGVLALNGSGAAIFLTRPGRGQVNAAYSPAAPWQYQTGSSGHQSHGEQQGC